MELIEDNYNFFMVLWNIAGSLAFWFLDVKNPEIFYFPLKLCSDDTFVNKYEIITFSP